MIRTHLKRYEYSVTTLATIVITDINGKVIGGLLMFSDDITPMMAINNLI